MKRKRKSGFRKEFTIERLEDRRLLATDVAIGISPLRSDPPAVQQQTLGDSDQNVRLEFSGRRDGQSNDRDQKSIRVDLRLNLSQLERIEARQIDGTENNLESPSAGSAGSQLLRASNAEYSDGISEPAGEDRPSPREISNILVSQTTTETNERNLTDLTWLWGQFIDHDIDLTETGDPLEDYSIKVPVGDPFFDPFGTGTAEISLNRSEYDHLTGTSADNPREQINQITAFLDGSVVYGSDDVRASELRTFEGGLLKTSEGDLLPFNESGLPNAGGTGDNLFLAGDVRANENVALTAMHTLWVREHNRIAGQIAERDSSLADEQIYQMSKTMVTAEIQAITFNEFLPALLGRDTISRYSGYDPNVNPGINNVFSTAAYRFGHSMLSSELLRLDPDGSEATEGNISLQNAFFSPGEITDNGIDSILMGAANSVANEIDNQVIDDVRNFLFGPPGAGGFDLASLNIQRGRDHGLADYNQVRQDFGLARVSEFSQITSDPELAQKLQNLYGNVDNVDVWVGGLAENHVSGSSMGELFSAIIVDQFERIRDGDRLWYENVFSGRQLESINNTSLADVIERNTDLDGIGDSVFFAGPDHSSSADEMTDRRTRERPRRRFFATNDITNGGEPMEFQTREERRRDLPTNDLPQRLAGINLSQSGVGQSFQDRHDHPKEQDRTEQDRERERRHLSIDNVFESLL